MKVIKFAPGLIPVLKHGTHDQKTHGSWAHGSSFGEFTLEEGADSKKLAIYSHPNGTRVIFQNLSKVESSSPMVRETLETIDGLSKKYPIPNLTFVVQSGEGGGIIPRGYDGVCYSQSGSKKYTERIGAWLESKNMPPIKDATAPYIAIRQRVLAPDSVPRVTYTSDGGGFIRPTRTPEQKTAYLKELITHEWGHALDRRTNAISSAQYRSRDKASTSAYGNKNGREFFAETFAAFELGGLVKDRPDNIPNYSKASEYLQMESLRTRVSKESFEGFITYENFENGEPLLIEDGFPLDFDEPVSKHLPGGHDQKDHGSWATGGGMGHLSESTAKEIEDSKALFQEIMGADNDLKETLIGYGYQGDLDYEKLQDRLARRYMDTGMGKNTAILQARIDMGRVAYAMKNAEEKTQYEEIIQKNRASAAAKISEHAEDDGQTADAMERGLAYAEERVLSAMKNGTVTIASSEEVLSAVLEDGRYKNQFETRTSGGKLDVGVRKVGEGLATGTPAGTKLAERPIYGFLTDNETVHTYDSKRATQIATEGTWLDKHEVSRNLDWETTTSINSYKVDQYGEVRFTLKPEVRGRTTLTIGDSLRTGVMADAISNPKPDLVNMGLYKTGAVHHMGGNPTADYLETQIHGGVKVSDIAHIYVPAGRVTAVKAMVEAKGLNIPVSARAGS
jgi:hypothetical protein